jgi:8-oxo-dGTP diphosphatase
VVTEGSNTISREYMDWSVSAVIRPRNQVKNPLKLPANTLRAMNDQQPTLVVGAAVVDDLERPRTLLAARRTEPSRLAGGWELPGGKVEPGEEPLDALRRELTEELGVTVEIGAELPAPEGVGWELPPSHRMRVWLVKVTGGVPAPIEDHDEIRILRTGQWRDVAWLPADVPVVEALIGRAVSGEGTGEGMAESSSA